MSTGYDTTAEASRLLRFHLGEVAVDLSRLWDRLKALSGNDRGVDWERRDALAGAVSVLEHVAGHHLGESQRLMNEVLGRDITVEPLQEQLPPPPRDLVELERGQHRLTSGIRRCGDEVRELLLSLEAEDSAALANVLGHLITQTREFLSPLATQLHSVALVFYQQEHPEEANQEALDQQKATPRRELQHRHAKTLQQCPHCEAPLQDDDRTSDGSFCESCGTRWILPGQV
ncbi:MAG: zinc ribbon domain-containing protein [Proteobacteria bacterium]|nr:zinc ribbon domain-containing protein [Pseudomonadota bacterium]